MVRRSLALALVVTLSASTASHARERPRPLRTPGPKKLLFIFAEFEDVKFGQNRTFGWRHDQSVDHMIYLTTGPNGLSNYWEHNSYGRISEIQGTYTQRYTLGPVSDYNDGADYWAMRRDMVAAALADGFDQADFDDIALNFPDTRGFPAGALGTPGTIWHPGDIPSTGGMVHEYGHTQRLGHASHWEGGSEVYPGVHREGRDGFFMMGSGGGVLADGQRFPPINLPMRYKAGWVEEQLVGRTSNTSGIYRISQFDRADVSGDVEAGRELGMVFNHDNKEWWVTFAPTLANRLAADGGEGLAHGVIVHQLSGDVTRSLDFTPGSQGFTRNTEDYIDAKDGALVIGNTFTFPDSFVSLTPISQGVDEGGVEYIDVRLSFDEPLPGDYNSDGTVDAADYTVWRDAVGAPAGTLPNDTSGGAIGQPQYLAWSSNYGATSDTASVLDAVPEPTALTLLCAASVFLPRRRLAGDRI